MPLHLLLALYYTHSVVWRALLYLKLFGFHNYHCVTPDTQRHHKYKFVA